MITTDQPATIIPTLSSAAWRDIDGAVEMNRIRFFSERYAWRFA